MVLHKVSARRETWTWVRPCCRHRLRIANIVCQTVSPCELWRSSQRKAQTHSHFGIGMRKKTERIKLGTGFREDWVYSGCSHLHGEKAIFVPVSREVWPRPWGSAHPRCRPYRDHRVQVWWQSSNLREKIFVYHKSIPVGLSLDLWPRPWD